MLHFLVLLRLLLVLHRLLLLRLLLVMLRFLLLLRLLERRYNVLWSRQLKKIHSRFREPEPQPWSLR
jgi:hypothetical protein